MSARTNDGRRLTNVHAPSIVFRPPSRLFNLFTVLMLLCGLCACSPTALEAASPLPTLAAPLLPTRTSIPTETPLPPTPPPTVTPVPTLIPTVAVSTDGWREVRSGVQ